MNILFIKYVIVGYMVSEIPIISVFGYFPLHIYPDIISRFNNNYLN